MNKRNIFVLSIIICLICNFFGVQMTRAWFVSGGSLGTGEYAAAKVYYLPTLTPAEEEKSLYGSLIAGNQETEQVYLVPGDEMLSTPDLSIENFSTVTSNVRVKIDISLPDTTIDDNMVWQHISGTTYQYGLITDIMNGETVVASDVFMGLLQVTFASTTIANTVIPNGTAPVGTFGESSYLWYFVNEAPTVDGQISFANAWELKLSDSTDVPALSTDRQFYNVINSISIVGESFNSEYQDAFNSYFSENYASQQIDIAISYYAKQSSSLMAWSEFSQSVLTAVTPLS